MVKMRPLSSSLVCLSATLLFSFGVVSADIQGSNSSSIAKDDSDGTLLVDPIAPPDSQMQADRVIRADDDDSNESTEAIPENAMDLRERDLEAETKAFREEQDKYEKEMLELENLEKDLKASEERFEVKKKKDEEERKKERNVWEEQMDKLSETAKELEGKEEALLERKADLEEEEKELKKEEEEREKEEKQMEERKGKLADSKKELDEKKRKANEMKEELATDDMEEYEKVLRKPYEECMDFPELMKNDFQENMGEEIKEAKICYKKKER